MNFFKSLRIHGYIKEITPVDDGGWVGIELKLEYRHDVQGECELRIWHSDARHYHIGQELCGMPSKRGASGNLQIDARIEKISTPFARDQWVEMQMKLAPRDDILGNCRFRIWPEEAMDYQVGDEACFVFKPLEGI